MIELRHITKHYGPLLALDDVSVTVAPGCILGLLGENGAGKSTLMQVLFGLVRAESGEIATGGSVVRVHSPRAAAKLGIGMVHQHFKLVPTLTGLENLRLFMRGKAGVLRGRAAELLARLRWQVPLDEPVENLAVGQQQRIEIAKALLAMEQARGRTGTLILDEPTAVLTPQETGELFAALKALRDGGTAIVFISHKLGEVTQICDQLAILRRGRLVHAGPAKGEAGGISVEEMAEKMVGSRVEMPRLARQSAPVPQAERTAVLALKGVSTSQLKRVSLVVRGGEILGIAGVDGNGQSHMAQVILGTRTPEGGEVLIRQQPAGALRQRLDEIAFIAEDRQREALVLELSVEDNLLLKDYRGAPFSTLGWLRLKAWRKHAETLMRQFDVRAGSATATVGRLSGGNQQKVVLARELFTAPAGETPGAGVGGKRIVVAVNPTRGLDVGATVFVLQKLLEARARGAAILLIHSDLDELLAVSDRVAVLFNGALTDAAEFSKEMIGRLMLGLSAAPPPRPQPRGNSGGPTEGGA